MSSPTPTSASRDLTATAEQVLAAAVRTVVGSDDVAPRPGQLALMKDLTRTLDGTGSNTGGDTGAGRVTADGDTAGQAAGIAPTGCGKSLAYLSPAAAAAAVLGSRTIVSTESLALQAQIIDKDAPVVAAACEQVTGYRPSVAVHKGWSNYVCGETALQAAREVLTGLGENPSGPAGESPAAELRRLRRAMDAAAAANRRAADVHPDMVPLLAWALGEVEDGGSGDKNAYPGDLTDPRSWEAVSVASSDCLGAEKCPLAEWCLPRAARAAAAEADIIVTNHTMLGLQAAKDVPVVVGSKTLGRFDNIIVDEAHGLPATVRSQGSVEVSERRVAAVVAAIGRTLDDRDKAIQQLLTTGRVAAESVGAELATRTRTLRAGGVARLDSEADPLEDSGDLVRAWCRAATQKIATAQKNTSSRAAEMKLRRAAGRLEDLEAAVKLVRDDRPGVARWVEMETPGKSAANPSPFPVVRYTPVDVAPMLRANLWTAPVLDDDAQMPQGDPEERPRYDLNVAVVSATLPNGFTYQAGLKAVPQHYDSPFDDAYGASVLFVPRAVDATDVAALAAANSYGKKRLDTGAHRDWALGHMKQLVEANGGRALVLAATATAGRVYAEQLRRHAAGRWQVYSQWDAMSLRAVTAAWKADETSILVGTRSLMTGVDAPGETCSLVIVDRPARAASNPVDDARVEAIVANTEMDRWAADRLVYVSDAQMLLEQAAGRLIRSVGDAGMVAVLDPRLLKVGPMVYPKPTRDVYLAALERFHYRVSDPVKATVWLAARRAAEDAAAVVSAEPDTASPVAPPATAAARVAATAGAA